ncbi:MAG TPA: hypothetical protein VLQ89_01315 [Candidatus Binatia bacterium]|nr:hypothetical protein [Candidatus Binatia bacterium]
MLKSKIKKINPEKSNKLIYAVAAGLAIVLAVFFALALGSGGRDQLPADTLAYLKKTEGLIEVRIHDAEKTALIIFNSDSKNADNFERIAYYAAVRLSKHWPDCRVLLAKNLATDIVYEVEIKNGAVAGAGPIAAGSDQL